MCRQARIFSKERGMSDRADLRTSGGKSVVSLLLSNSYFDLVLSSVVRAPTAPKIFELGA